MGRIYNKVLKGFGVNEKDYSVHIEEFQSALDVALTNDKRERTSTSFHDMRNSSNGGHKADWLGVKNYAEALELLKYGHQPTVEKMRGEFKASARGEAKRFSFKNDIVGATPVVPLAMKGVPNCMINTYMKPIKAKVVSVYYDMTDSAGVGSNEIIAAGQILLGTIVELERQGYRFNVYCVQAYSDGNSSDMLVVKVKDATQPIDLKRISFPMAHTAFFRMIGFDWYSRVPDGKFRDGYGRRFTAIFNAEKVNELYKELFGKTAVTLNGSLIRANGKEYVKEVLENANSNKR